jgi:hypothetical protein
VLSNVVANSTAAPGMVEKPFATSNAGHTTLCDVIDSEIDFGGVVER